METVLEEIYDKYGFSKEVGISYFLKFKNKILTTDFVFLMDLQMRNYPHRYVTDFFLSTPFLWEGISSETWIKLLLRSDSRPNATKEIDSVAMFADIGFLSRYVGVDALRFFVNSSVDVSEKVNSIKYFRKNPYELVPSDLDEEDFDGIYFVDKETLITLRDRLQSECGMSLVDFSEENIHGYLDKLQGDVIS